jgi:hypothetical protein
VIVNILRLPATVPTRVDLFARASREANFFSD